MQSSLLVENGDRATALAALGNWWSSKPLEYPKLPAAAAWPGGPVNDNGRVVGFYVAVDGQDHGFMADVFSALVGDLTGTPIADPTIPNVAGEPGATFVFSQILGI